MYEIPKAIVFGLATTLSVVFPAAAVDMIYGEYGGDCGPTIGCSLIVETIKTGKSYKVTFETFIPRTHGKPSPCTVSGTATLHQGKLLVGEFGPGKPFEILKSRNSDMLVRKTDNMPCGTPLKVNGTYRMVGD